MYKTKNMKEQLWHRIVPKFSIEQIESNGRSYPYLYPIGDLAHGGFHKGFHVCTNQGSFLRNFLTNSELKIN